MAYGSVTVGSGSAILIIAFNPNRKSLIISNEGSSKIFIANDSSVTTATGISIPAGGIFTEDSGGDRMFTGNIYAISADSTNDVRYWERI